MTSCNKEPFDFAPLVIPLASDKQLNIVLRHEQCCQSVLSMLGQLKRKVIILKKNILLTKNISSEYFEGCTNVRVVFSYTGRCWWTDRWLICWMVVWKIGWLIGWVRFVGWSMRLSLPRSDKRMNGLTVAWKVDRIIFCTFSGKIWVFSCIVSWLSVDRVLLHVWRILSF